jgi:hypothetical protein
VCLAALRWAVDTAGADIFTRAEAVPGPMTALPTNVTEETPMPTSSFEMFCTVTADFPGASEFSS